MNLRPSICLITLALTLAFTGLPLRATAEESKPTVDLTGRWKVTQSSTNTQVRPSEGILNLKQGVGTLTGTLRNVSTVNGNSHVYEWEIKEVKLQGSEISFSVTHPFEVGNGDVTSSYQGKINGGTIKGTFKTEFLGKSFTRDWKAERLKE